VHQIANPLNLLDVFGGRRDYQFNKNNRLGAKSDRLLAPESRLVFRLQLQQTLIQPLPGPLSDVFFRIAT
jgi:hypothetical protein